MKEVLAIIVTFNRPPVLEKCLLSLFNQQYAALKVHVVVNSNDQGTIDVLESFVRAGNPVTFECFDNVGPAGGFYYGLKTFQEGTSSYAWLMDDDVVVDPDCLTHLLNHIDKHEYVFPKVLKSSGEEIVSYGWWGILLTRALVEKVGLPMKELFYWSEDTEYLQNRIPRIYNVEPYRCKEAVLYHLHHRTSKHPSWYYYYVVRNTFYYRTRIVDYTWARTKRTIIMYVKYIANILFREERKIRKLYLLVYGTYHGLIGKLGKSVDPGRNR
ncbi:glycosyltransferase [Ohtaekwangia sp.]|uniref:glycosyltransferase n=1 Tax=Ohtaekwangia sp. TaxID=2066019 RepID=UPI002F93FBBF